MIPKLIKKIKSKLISKIKKIYFRLKFNENIFLNNKVQDDYFHLTQVMNWLCVAQDNTKCGGVSSEYDILSEKWGQAYRETTGYIIETFIEYFKSVNKMEFLDRAIKMADWELSIQCEDGSFGEIKKDGSIGKKIFNTGQIIIGLLSIYKETKKSEYLKSATLAGDWLIKNQETDGSWINFTTQGKRTYHSRVAWPLLSLYKETNQIKYKTASEKNIYWVINQQKENYWFDNTSLTDNNSPWTHLIVYTISGLIEFYLLCDKKEKIVFDSFYGTASKLLDIYNQNQDEYLKCSFNKNWASEDNYSCLTGDAQSAIVWMQIYQITKEERFKIGANKIIEQLKKTQITDTNIKGIKGGIFGSYPIHGDYAPYKIINWASKFFADSLILKNKI